MMNSIFIFFLGPVIMLAFFIVIHYTTKNIRKDCVISFKDAFRLTGLSIVVTTINGKVFNFILDSGSDKSYFDINDFKSNRLNNDYDLKKEHIITCEGVYETDGSTSLNIEMGCNEYECNFILLDLSKTKDALKERNGVTIHGILGCDFCNSHNGSINFKDYTLKLD